MRKETWTGAILEALLATPSMDEKHLAEKLYEISAENFGRRVHEFYLDVIISNNFAKETEADEPVTKRIFKDSILYTTTSSVYAGQGFKTYVESF